MGGADLLRSIGAVRYRHQIGPDAGVNQPRDDPALLAPQLGLLSPEPVHHNVASATNSVLNPRCHHGPQDRVVDTALHNAAFVADQLDPIALDTRHHAPAAVYTHRGFVRNDREYVNDSINAAQVSLSR